jgi:ribosomal protein S18 acetylase RimI-like enzyme
LVTAAAVTLRPLEHRDLGFLCEVRHHPETLRYLHDPRVFSLEQVQQWFVEQKPEWLVVESAHARVGYVRISDKHRAGASVKVGMDIHPDYRREGIATAAYQLLFRRLRGEGWRSVWLEVLSDNAAARSLYEKLGFAYDRQRDRLVQRRDIQCESLAMVKSLGAPAHRGSSPGQAEP